MDAEQVELSLRLAESPNGVAIELWQGSELMATHWGVDLEAATLCASISVASYVADGPAHPG